MNAEQILDKIVEIKDPVTNMTVGEMISNLKATARNEKDECRCFFSKW